MVVRACLAAILAASINSLPVRVGVYFGLIDRKGLDKPVMAATLPVSKLPWKFVRYPYLGFIIDPDGHVHMDAAGKLSVDVIHHQKATVTIDDVFMNKHIGLLDDVNYEIFDDAEVDPKWNEAWLDMVGSAWAYKAASVHPPDN